MKKLMMAVACGAMLIPTFGQAPAAPQTSPKKNLTTVLGVSVGMTMEQTLQALQERSKRFHVIPKISADDNSLTLLTDLQMSSVRLGWKDDVEFIASGVQVSFYHGKVVRIIVQSDSNIGSKSDWDEFIRQLPKTSKNRSSINSEGIMINPIENCAIGENGENVLMIVRDADNWNAFIEEKRKLERFFNSVPRRDEVLD